MYSELMEPRHHGVEDSSIRSKRSNKSQASRELSLVKKSSIHSLREVGYSFRNFDVTKSAFAWSLQKLEEIRSENTIWPSNSRLRRCSDSKPMVLYMIHTRSTPRKARCWFL
ncbi:uncharacterized protein LOC111485316 [Cucurbita maxima]|uniref:Uncharacterized protein LOC111485316 n=1 Tax=Cucurbita maxima TaxID=3661 RepID=A0A6J1JK61_CUCMA|nr:uncharacterized protein LOC111485316 [Cucurbita maxima]